MIKTKIIGFVILASSLHVFAQFKSAEIGVDGLTCSACTRSVEMSIRKLDFIQDVEMNLEHTEGKITFKPDAKVDIEKVAKAVVNAGFSVRYLNANVVFSNITVNDGYCFAFEAKNYQFIKTQKKELNGEVTLRFLGKEFLSRKEYKKYEPDIKPACAGSTGTTLYVTL